MWWLKPEILDLRGLTYFQKELEPKGFPGKASWSMRLPWQPRSQLRLGPAHFLAPSLPPTPPKDREKTVARMRERVLPVVSGRL